MKRLLSIALTFAKVSTQRELSYRAEFAGNFVNAFGVDAFMAVVAVSVIFVHTDSLRGWSAGEMLAVVGIWCFVLGLMSMVMFPSLNQVVEDVHEGTFDYVLMKPVPSLFLASTRSFAAANSAFVLMGLSLALFGIFALEAGQLSWRIALFPVLLASGLAIFYALLIAMTTLVFWAVRLDNIEHLFNVFFRTGRDPSWLMALAPVIASLAVYGATRFWRLGLRRYSSASSYTPHQHDQLIGSSWVSITSLVRLAYCHDRSPSLGTRVETSVLS